MKKNTLIIKSIYEFTDPVDYIKYWKKTTYASYSEMAICTYISAKSFYHKVINGEKMYSMKRVIPISMMLRLGKREMEYFEIMSFLLIAKSPEVMKIKILNKFRPKRFR